MSAAFPKGRTAFLVIHGIGEQNPFETLDSFGRGLVNYLEDQKVGFALGHKIKQRKGASGAKWAESFVRICSLEGHDYLDVHEYYWAYLTEKKISTSQVWDWLRQTLKGMRKFYTQEPELLKNYLKWEWAKDSTRWAWARWILVRQKTFVWLGWSYLLLRLFFPLIRTFRLLTPGWGWLSFLRQGLEKLGATIVVGYIGDIAIYTTMDQKSSHFQIRQQILGECQALLEEITSDGECDKIILAGHSLGSVIAYDTLNRLNLKANLEGKEKIYFDELKGLITFGSPLDKIAFFFREHAGRGQYVRRQIMEHLHSFKSKKYASKQKTPILENPNPLIPQLKDLPWVNYHSRKDPVSGHLDFYQGVDNVNSDLKQSWGKAHTGYWNHPPFYLDIARRFLL